MKIIKIQCMKVSNNKNTFFSKREKAKCLMRKLSAIFFLHE